MISVARKYTPNGIGATEKWFSADNRRLWVAKHLERLGKLDRIKVNVVRGIPLQKMTTNNGGVSIRVRGDPGGYGPFRKCQSLSFITVHGQF